MKKKVIWMYEVKSFILKQKILIQIVSEAISFSHYYNSTNFKNL